MASSTFASPTFAPSTFDPAFASLSFASPSFAAPLLRFLCGLFHSQAPLQVPGLPTELVVLPLLLAVAEELVLVCLGLGGGTYRQPPFPVHLPNPLLLVGVRLLRGMNQAARRRSNSVLCMDTVSAGLCEVMQTDSVSRQHHVRHLLGRLIRERGDGRLRPPQHLYSVFNNNLSSGVRARGIVGFLCQPI